MNVFIDIPKDVQNSIYEQSSATFKNENENENSIKYDNKIDLDIENIVNLINNSKKPILYIGQGVAISRNDCNKKIIQLMENALIPATSTIHALGCIPSNHKLIWVCLVCMEHVQQIIQFKNLT